VVSLLTLQLLFVGFAVSNLNQNNKAMEEILWERYVNINNFNTIRYELNNISLCLHKASAGGHDPIEQVQHINDSIMNVNSTFHRLETSVSSPEAIDIISRFKTLYDNYQEVVKETVSYFEQGESQDLVTNLSGKEEEMYLALATTVEEFMGLQERLMNEALERSQASSARMMRMLMVFFVVYLVLAIGISVWILRSMIGNIAKLSRVISSAADKTSDMPRIDIDSRDELGIIAEAYNRMAAGIENYAKNEQKTALFMQDRAWLSTNIAELTTAFQDAPNPQELGSYFINRICSLLEAQYGVVYLRQSDLNYSRLAAYAADSSLDTPQSIQIGQGLIGQSALENKKIVIEQTPEDYVKISSALGSAAPVSLTILPVEFGDQVLAVVEIASFKPFSALYHEFLDKIASNFAISLFGLMKQMQVNELLKESQVLNEELRVQAEELQNQSEELQSQHEELRTINEQLEANNLKLEQRRIELEAIRLELQEKNFELMQASQFKSEFLANMSHELRTPLNSILILAEILAQNPDGNLMPKQVDFVKTIYNSGHDLLNLINQILDLTKIESGKMEVNYGEISLSTLLESIKNHGTLEAMRKDIDFSVESDPGLPDIIYSDEQHLLHIINNLLSNAFKFAPHGWVKLGLKRSNRFFNPEEYPALHNSSLNLEITVSDNGIGIPENKQELIFEAFVQVNGGTNRNHGGTGLGLSICRRTVELLGGYIEVQSQPGRGSTFRVYIPCDVGVLSRQIASTIDQDITSAELENQDDLTTRTEQEQECEIAEAEKSPADDLESFADRGSLAGKTVLLVDDDMRNVFALTSVLEGSQIRVLFAENGREAIEVLRQHPEIDLVIMDIMMPEMDGYDAIHNIRLIPEYQDLPIIALTAKAMKGDRLKCIEVGASDYINKPVDVEQLLSLISVWMYKK